MGASTDLGRGGSAESLLIWLRLLQLAGLKLAEGILKVRQGALGLSDLGVVATEDVLVSGRMAHFLRGL